MTQTSSGDHRGHQTSMEYANLCMTMQLRNARYSESGVRRCRVRASALSGWCPSQEQRFADSFGQRGSWSGSVAASRAVF
jgi:hypothetical protein